MVILVIAALMLGLHLYKQSQNSYFDPHPIKMSELDFEDISSEDLYKPCVKEGNESIKKQIENGQLKRRNYSGILMQFKQACRCYATNGKLLKAFEAHKAGTLNNHRYHQILLKQLNDCMKKIFIKAPQ